MNLPKVTLYFDIKISPVVEMTSAESLIFNLCFVNGHFK